MCECVYFETGLHASEQNCWACITFHMGVHSQGVWAARWNEDLLPHTAQSWTWKAHRAVSDQYHIIDAYCVAGAMFICVDFLW